MLSLNGKASLRGSDHPLKGFPSRRNDNVLIVNIEWARNKALKPETKKAFRGTEKSAQQIQRIIESFCPHGGKVLDFFEDTLRTAIAALATNRECILISKNKVFFNKVVQRLFNCVPLKKICFVSKTT